MFGLGIELPVIIITNPWSKSEYHIKSVVKIHTDIIRRDIKGKK